MSEKNISEEAAEKAKAMGEKVQGVYESAREKVHETMESLKEKNFNEMIDNASKYVKENPGKFMLIAFGLGLTAGFMIRNACKKTAGLNDQ